MPSDYSAKLSDPRWQRRRLEEMQRADWKCECCGAAKKTLHVHHLDYRGEPWEVPAGWLEVLCADCHAWREVWNRVRGRSTESTGELMRRFHAPAGGPALLTRQAISCLRHIDLQLLGLAEYKRQRRRVRALGRQFRAYLRAIGYAWPDSQKGGR
jgi:hypothetical protein